jgi:uncharacterized protein (DUF2384 family)
MSWKIGMPSLGHTMEEAKLVQWLKAKGDASKRVRGSPSSKRTRRRSMSRRRLMVCCSR